MMDNLLNSSAAEIKRIQWCELQKQLEYLQRNSPYYQQVFKRYSIAINSIKNNADFRKIPITKKEDLQNHHDDFLCVPKEDIIDFVTTSGTLGEPVSLALNEHDLERLATNEMRSFEMVGVKKQDTVQITTTLDRRFMAGMAYFLGLRKLGASVVRSGSGVPQLQWDSIFRFQPKYLVAVPSFLLKLIEYAKNHSINMQNCSVKAVICIGEPIRDQGYKLNTLGKRIAESWNIELFSTYASTEMATAFTECPFHSGNHEQSDLIFSEILNENGIPVKEGEPGELVITTLQNQTMPLLRFATGDIVTFTNGNCECVRNTRRLGPVIGRKQQMIKLKGTSLYPQHILNVLNEIPEIESFVLEASSGTEGIDNLTINLPESISENLLEDIKDRVRGKLQVVPNFKMIPAEELQKLKFPKTSRKPIVFIDHRK